MLQDSTTVFGCTSTFIYRIFMTVVISSPLSSLLANRIHLTLNYPNKKPMITGKILNLWPSM